MCGITGFVTEANFHQDNSIKYLDKMISKIHHRGPDSSGKWIYNNSLYFGHTRLSIQDLSVNANQPMFSNNGQFCIIFNGEIYNHHELRKQINYNWKSSSDTETILGLLENYSFSNVVNKLEGMFAFACFDIFNKKLYLTRDYAGEKPLYFGWSNNVFFFSSELKSICVNNYFQKKLNPDAVNSLIQYSYIKTPLTIFENLYKLAPNKILECSLDINKYKNNKIINFNEKNNYFKIYPYENNITNNFNNKKSLIHQMDEFSILFKKTIKSCFISDVPVGVFLSGGIDSTLTSVFAKQHTDFNFESFSIGFENLNYDESRYASKISNHFGIINHKSILSPSDMQNVIPKLPLIYDEPFSDSSQIPTFLLSKLASSKVKVVLSGDGGDELFGGYNRYFNTQKLWNVIKFFPFKLRNKISQVLITNNSLFIFVKYLAKIYNPHIFSDEKILKILNKLKTIKDKKTLYLSMLKEINDVQKNTNHFTNNFDSVFDDYFNKSSEFIDAMMRYDFDTYLNDDILVKVDRASMANSLEVRAPFLNKEIIKFSRSLPINHKIYKGGGKLILKEILNSYLPNSFINRPKMGFGIPLREWLSNDLNSWMKDILSINNLNKHNLFKSETIIEMIENINSTSINKLWSVLVFQMWYMENFE